MNSGSPNRTLIGRTIKVRFSESKINKDGVKKKVSRPKVSALALAGVLTLLLVVIWLPLNTTQAANPAA